MKLRPSTPSMVFRIAILALLFMVMLIVDTAVNSKPICAIVIGIGVITGFIVILLPSK